ncbi:hypothetical protein [Pedobacter gandavensis]|uniref:DUF3575 domain-containing protein n=1 Tax=Pedobacter gandavensis TaxID=2679963 RepID=A0ABR6EY07_9SPHI|nr:hypothetical protein [Pedobacter gandavensis]MBB2150112.1 hypothetical protein [Pedobacter gandavensis]
MKRNLIFILTCISSFVYSTMSYAQKTGLVHDQNPRYLESRARYMGLADSLNLTQGSTVQNTYKAYDWYTAREERRQLRRERNNSDWYSPYDYSGGYYYPSFNYYPRFGYSLGLGYGHYGRNGGFNIGFNRHWGRW